MKNLSVNQVPTLDSREVAKMIGKRHDNLVRDIDNYISIIENSKLRNGLTMRVSDFFIKSNYQSGTPARNYKCYGLTKMGCEMVANKMTGKKGVLFTAAYVQKFNDMENEPPQIVKDYLALSTEDRAIAYFTKSKQVKQQAALLEYQRPKVLFADSVADSNGSILIGDLAKMLKQNGIDIGATRLFRWMRENGYLIKRQGTDYNMPTQKSMDLGLFRIKETSITHSNGYVTISKTPKVTGKGQQYFINKFLNASDQNNSVRRRSRGAAS